MTEVEALAASWASVEGKLESFLEGCSLYEGYMADAASLIERLQKRGFKIVPVANE